MFNQFKNALESVAQQPIRILDPASSSEPNGDDASRSSLELQGAHSATLSSSQLAESAVSSLRKSFTSQRVHPSPDSAKPPSSTPTTRKSTLEERLRRAAQGSAVDAGSLPSSTRGRSDSVASQTKQTSSRVTSSSPATRGRPADVPKSHPNKPASRTKTIGSSGLGSKPSSRTSSPTPTSKLPSRSSSPAPGSRNASAAQRTASSGPTTTTRTPSRPSSRVGSPTPAAKTRRASELTAKHARAASPSPLTRHQSPLRRSSITVNNVALSNTSITTSASTDSKAEFSNTSSDEISILSMDDKEEEGQQEGLDPGTAELTESFVVQPGISEKDVITNEDKDLQTQIQLPPPANEPLSNAELSTTDFDLVVAEATSKPSELETITATPLQTDLKDLEKEQSIPRQEIGADILATPQEIQSNDHEHLSDSALAPVTQEMSAEADLHPSGSNPNIPSPKLAILESPKSSTIDPKTEPPNGISDNDRSIEIESLQTRLKELEQRFSDVSISFKRLQAEKLAADAILKENSPLESFTDLNALRDYFANLRIKDEVFQDEIKRLTGKIELQDDRLLELREAHSFENRGHSEELRQVKTHLKETEALFEAAQRATTNVEGTIDKQKEDISRLEKELEQSKNLAKEEEEKRVKAITLLKTVRQKLVKADKDREDVMKEMASMREKEKVDKDKEQSEKINLLRELEVSQSAHAQEITSLRAQFERDLVATRDRHEQEINALKGQNELDLATIKTSHNKELASASSRISALENSIDRVTRDKNAFFEQLQLRQAELESAQAHADMIQHQNTELEFQLREANDRLALVREEYAELQREAETRSREPAVSGEEIARMVSATEAKYEARLREMKWNISVLEKERHESEVDWSRKLKEKVRELEDLKRMLGSATRMRESEESMVADLRTALEANQETNKGLQREVAELTLLKGQVEELERSLNEQEHETDVRIRVLERQIDEHKAREAQLKQGNKTLRDELRKVQSSAALLERQRNPGVGYWSARAAGSGSDTVNGPVTDSRVSISSPSPVDSPSRPSSPTPSNASIKTDEEVNLEYVRNVVLQFLEHKERRPQLVKVLSIILHFTPQETRRLIAKV